MPNNAIPMDASGNAHPEWANLPITSESTPVTKPIPGSATVNSGVPMDASGNAHPEWANLPITSGNTSQQSAMSSTQATSVPASDSNSFATRAGLSLKKDLAEANQTAQNREANGWSGLAGDAVDAVIHPWTTLLSATPLVPTLNQVQAQAALQSGTAAQKLEMINQQIAKLPNTALMDNPEQWTKEAIGNHIAPAIGLGLVAGTMATAGADIPVLSAVGGTILSGLADTSLTGLAAGAVTGLAGANAGHLAGTLANPGTLDKPTDPNDPNDPYYSEANQTALRHIDRWSNIGGMAGGSFGIGLKNLFQPNKTAVANALPDIDTSVLSDQAAHADNLLKTAAKYGIDTSKFPTNPDEFVKADIDNLHDQVQTARQQATDAQNQAIIEGAKANQTTPAPFAQIASDASNQTMAKNQAGSSQTDAAYKGWLNNQKAALGAWWNLADEHGILPNEVDKVNAAIKSSTTIPGVQGLLGSMYSSDSPQWNFITGALQGGKVQMGISSDTLPMVKSILSGLKDQYQKNPTGETAIPAQLLYNHLNPVVTDAIDNSVEAHLMNPTITPKPLTAEAVATLKDGIYKTYGQGNAFPDIGENNYGSEVSSGYAQNRNRYYGQFSPKITDNQGAPYLNFHQKATENLPSLLDLSTKMANNNGDISHLMDTEEYRQAFGAKTNFGDSDSPMNWQQTKNGLDSSISNVSNKLGVTVSDGIKAGFTPGTLNAADTAGLQRFMQYGKDNQTSTEGWLAQNPGAASIVMQKDKDGNISSASNYQQILDGLLDPNGVPHQKSAVLNYLQNQVDPAEFTALKQAGTNHFMSKVYDALSSGNPDDAANVIKLAGQYKQTFPGHVDPILSQAFDNLGINLQSPNSDMASAIAQKAQDFIGQKTAAGQDFAKQIQKVQSDLVSSLMDKQKNSTFNNLNIMKVGQFPAIGMDVLSKMVRNIPFVPKSVADAIVPQLSKDKLNAAIGDSLTSRANYNAAMQKITEQQQAQKSQKIQNIFLGRALGQ